MIIKLNQDLLAGVVLLLFGALFSVGAYWHSIGTLDEMGPGYFPLIAGCILLIIGFGVAAGGLLSKNPTQAELHVRPIGILFASQCIVALVMPFTGLWIGAVLIVMLASLASAESRFWEVFLAGCVLSAFSVALFVYGLGIPLPLEPTLRPR